MTVFPQSSACRVGRPRRVRVYATADLLATRSAELRGIADVSTSEVIIPSLEHLAMHDQSEGGELGLGERTEQGKFLPSGVVYREVGRPRGLALGRPDVDHCPRPGRPGRVVERESSRGLVDFDF